MVTLLVVFIFVIAAFVTCDDSDITKSSIQREPLPRGSVTETAYFTDNIDWIGSHSTLTKGMRSFYQSTGVQPYLYITDEINGSLNPTNAEVEAFSNELYDALFSDEAHLLLIFFDYRLEYDRYHTWYLCGVQAKTVLDREAMDILLDYIDRYYYYDVSAETFFSWSFDEAGKRIMSVTKSPWPTVWTTLGIITGVVFVTIVAFAWWTIRKAQKNKEAEMTHRILNTPLETFGSDEAARLAKKYEQSDDKK